MQGAHGKNEEQGVKQIDSSLLQIIRELASELRPSKKAVEPTLDSILDRDLGIDSLGRTELLLRIERAFNVRLPDDIMLAETARDLLRAVLAADGIAMPLASLRKRFHAPGEVASTPVAAATLPEALLWHLDNHADRTHIYLYSDSDEPASISYAQLQESSEAVAAGLMERGLQPRETVAIMLPTCSDYFYSFLGIILAGGIPVPIYPPVRPTQIEEHLRRHVGILSNAGTTMLITVPEAKNFALLLKPHVRQLRHVVTVADLTSAGEGRRPFRGQAQDIAFLQYTSGSTSDPKGVIVTHANVLANLRTAGARVEVSSTDVFVSWLPLYHDMGLIGAWLGSLYYGMPLVVMSPLRFLARPSRWLWAIHRHGGTIAASPNFGYEMCLRKISDDELEGLDLSSWRFAFNGAEPVNPGTLERFAHRFSDYGFRAEAMAPVYGLAESTVALALPPPGRGPRIDQVQRDEFRRTGRALPADKDDASPLRFIACGAPLSGEEIRVVDAAGIEVPERQEGKLQFRGNSATSGYYRDAEATRNLFDGEWLDSGDRAYFAEGEIYITGRIKDIIIRAGRNIHPYELEEAIGTIPGIRKGCVVVFGSADAESGTERLIVVAETHERGTEVLNGLRQQIENSILDLVPVPPDDVILAPPHTILKTSSGKLRRAAVRQLYERGDLGRGAAAMWLQVVRLAWSACIPEVKRLMRAAAEWAYAAYAWTLFGGIGTLIWLAVVLLPRRSWRWGSVRAGARLAVRLSGTQLIVRGLEHLPRDTPLVLVANHGSYVDVPLICAALPIEVCYVAKRELMKSLFIGRLLRKLGTIFVERFDQQRSVEDAQQVNKAVREGQSLGFFPEGTFTRAAGVRPFHMGAFVAAAQAGVPVVPVTIRGSRSILRDESWFLRRAGALVIVGECLRAEGSDWQAAVKLRDAVRQTILRHSGEPDLENEPVL